MTIAGIRFRFVASQPVAIAVVQAFRGTLGPEVGRVGSPESSAEVKAGLRLNLDSS